ncbi:zinc finger, CCHC-type containing protein [Tanacetum coccineum]
MTTSVGNNSVFRSFFEKQKLTGPNFIHWYRQLCLVLSTKDKENYLEHPIPKAHVAPPGQQVPFAAIAAHATWVKGQKEVVVLMLLTMDLDIQRNLAHLDRERILHVQVGGSMGKTVNELHAMLKLHEDTLPKKDANLALHAIRAGRNRPPPKKDNPAKDVIFHQCGEIGRWRRNCPVYLAELMKKKKLSQGSCTLGIFTIELYSFPSKSWIYDTGYGTHICITTQGLRGSKKLKLGALSLYVGDGHRATIKAIGTYHLEIPSGLVIVLNNCHYAPSITRGVISVSCLFDDGFINRFDENNVISVSKNNLIYFMAFPRDGIFEIDMSCSNTNDSSMYAICNKRAKTNLDSSLLWHCHLGHISKKRIEKLQHDGLMNSIDIESLGKCVSCLSSLGEPKVTKMSLELADRSIQYPRGIIENVLIKVDKFILLIDFVILDMPEDSRVPIILGRPFLATARAMIDVFNKKITLRVGDNEVIFDVDQSIKRPSTKDGECYGIDDCLKPLSQEFLDHLKEHGIIAHHAPPYTPQNNGVSERRNRTLLDMVQSMMSQTALPKSFWDYALETATRILNMVPTKKVDKTSYEI